MGEWRNPTTYLGSSDPRLHFGLGSAATVESLTIIWPDGRHQTEGPFPAGQIRRILENS